MLGNPCVLRAPVFVFMGVVTHADAEIALLREEVFFLET